MAEAYATRRPRVGFFGWLKRLLYLALLAAAAMGGWYYYDMQREAEVLREIVSRLNAERRVAEVRVEEIRRDESGDTDAVRLKIVEYDVEGKALEPIFCDFSLNNVIHFEAFVIRLNDELVQGGEGKSVHLFRRAFALEEAGNTYESCALSKPMEVPGGYRIASDDRRAGEIERAFWRKFWDLALDEKRREAAGVKNAQVEAPATRFVADKIYKLVLEADGGLYIQPRPVPEIYKSGRGATHEAIKRADKPR